MRSLLAFIKKEFTEHLRCARLMITLALFVLLGIMNPAVAKLTPWLLEVMADSLAESGMTVTIVNVSALDSWVQFFKNMPIGLIAFVLLYGSVFTKEYSSGTLLLSLTKGFERYKVVVAKAVTLVIIWSLGYWLCYGITYFYNAYFWDNGVAHNLLFSALCWWLFGMLVISLITVCSTLSSSNTGVLLSIGIFVFGCSVVSAIPKAGKYLPTMLTDGNSLIYASLKAEDYIASLVITAVLTIVFFAISIPIFNKKHL